MSTPEVALKILGVSPGADAQEVEATYWRLVRDLSERRRVDREADEELEKVNWAYKAAIDYLRTTPPSKRKPPEPRKVPVRKIASLGVAATMVGLALATGLSYRAELQEHATTGVDEAHERFDSTVTWLQELGQEEEADAAEPPAANQPPEGAASR